LLGAADAMTFDNGWTQLDVVEEMGVEWVDEKSDAKIGGKKKSQRQNRCPP